MEFGSITLLEICQMAHGSRVAYCLTRGDFLFVTPEAPRYFRARTAGDLFGKSLYEFAVPCDLEKLQDFMRAHTHNGILSNDVSSKLTMMIRLVGSGQSVWVRMKTVPVTLRLLRCIDSVTVLASLKHHFADLSSFVMSDDDIAAIFSLPSGISTPQLPCDQVQRDDDIALSIAIPNDYDLPLELKGVSPYRCHEALMSTSPASPTWMLDSLDESLSSLAFEADWETESR
jgi:hypothetical protein